MPGTKNQLAKFFEAWHGSHADFERFSDDKIGTGEGAQVYGHGHYVGGAKATGETYMNQVTAKNVSHAASVLSIDPKHLKTTRDRESLKRLQDLINGDGLFSRFTGTDVIGDSGSLTRFVSDHLHRSKMTPNDTGLLLDALNWVAEKQRHLTLARPDYPGRLYQLRVNADPDKMLDWDAPIGKHPPEIYNAVGKMAEEGAGLIHGENDSATGSEMYRILSNTNGSPAAASKALYEAGIHGIKYKDQFSRGEPQWLLDGKDKDDFMVAPALGSPKRRDFEQFHRLHDLMPPGKRLFHLNTVDEIEQHYADGVKSLAIAADAAPTVGSLRELGEQHQEALDWLRDNKHRLTKQKQTYNYVIFDPNMIEHVRKYDLQGNLVHDYGVHAQPVDHDPFEGEHK